MARSYDEAKTDYERDILQNIEKHGWFCTCVFDPEGKDPGFAYSVGFTKTLGCPEFIVFGLGSQLMHSMLWEVFRQIRDGKMPYDGQRWSGVLDDHDCISRAVHPSNMVRDYLNSAMWFWGYDNPKGPLPAMQLFWPARDSDLFPWDDACPQDVRDSQVPLYLPNQALKPKARPKGLLSRLAAKLGF
jgi:hypothetical protein